MTIKSIIAEKTLILIAGALLIVIGISILVAPVEFYAASSIEVGSNISLMSELKAPAGLLLAAGAFIIIALFRPHLAGNALSLSALIYLSYALSRTLSMASDGMPADGLVLAALLEAILGLACLTVVIMRRLSPRN